MSRYLRSTPLLDIDHPAVHALVEQRGWTGLEAPARVGAVYAFVRDEIAFGYNASDDVPASQVLADGYGQCNTKTTLLMALLRAVGIPARFHAATVHKRLQKGVLTGLLYRFAPRDILHSWAEVFVGDRWVGLEGVILDRAYLTGVRAWFPGRTGPFLGYGVGTDDLAHPPIDWVGADTAIQATGISADRGVHDDPDSYYREHGPQLQGVRGWLFRHRARPAMNARVRAIRRSALLDDDLTCAVPMTGSAS